jgi:hypothetical protein
MVIACGECNAVRNYMSQSVLDGVREIRNDLAESVEDWVHAHGRKDPWIIENLWELRVLGWIVPG